MSAVVGKLDRFGLLNDSPSPSERVYVRDVHSETTADVRQVPDRDTDTDGAIIFSSFRSTFELSAADIAGLPQAETWMASRTPVKAVLALKGAFVQWVEPTRIVATDTLTPGEAALVRADYVMTRDAGNQSSHGVYLTRNALAPLGVTGSVIGQLAWPVDGVALTLSATDADTLAIDALDETGSVLDSVTDSPSGGRASVDFTTPSGTHRLDVEVSGTSVSEPALRHQGETAYVPK